MTLAERNVGQFVIDRPRQLGLEPVPHEQPRGRAVLLPGYPERVLGPENDCIAAVELECDPPIPADAFGLHFDGAEGCSLDVDVQFLDGGDEYVPPIRLSPKYG